MEYVKKPKISNTKCSSTSIDCINRETIASPNALDSINYNSKDNLTFYQTLHTKGDDSAGLNKVPWEHLRGPHFRRLEGLKQFLQIDNLTLSHGERKTVLMACIESRSVDITKSILRYFSKKGYIDAELVYSGINVASTKGIWDVAFEILLECEINKIMIDIETVNNVLKTMVLHGKVSEAWGVLQMLLDGKFVNVRADVTSYALIISRAAASPKHRVIMMQAFKLLESEPQLDIDESLFLSALSSSCCDGDFISASKLFQLYRSFYGVVQTRGYSLLLLSYIDSLEPDRQLPPVAQDEAIEVLLSKGECATIEEAQEKIKNDPIDTVEKKMLLYASVKDQDGVSAIAHLDAIVDFLLRSNLDTSALANLILQFFTVQNDVIQSSWYLGRMQKLGYRASLGSLENYQKLLARRGDVKKLESLRQYISELGYMNTDKAEDDAAAVAAAANAATAAATGRGGSNTAVASMISRDSNSSDTRAADIGAGIDVVDDDVLLLKSTLHLQKQKTYMNRLLHYVSTSTKSVERGLSRFEGEWSNSSNIATGNSTIRNNDDDTPQKI